MDRPEDDVWSCEVTLLKSLVSIVDSHREI